MCALNGRLFPCLVCLFGRVRVVLRAPHLTSFGVYSSSVLPPPQSKSMFASAPLALLLTQFVFALGYNNRDVEMQSSHVGSAPPPPPPLLCKRGAVVYCTASQCFCFPQQRPSPSLFSSYGGKETNILHRYSKSLYTTTLSLLVLVRCQQQGRSHALLWR